jgi:predicted O-methyltransferase YrrM
MLACLNGSKSIIECGTSFGVSTIYLALAVCRNAVGQRQEAYGVLTMEKDPSKLTKAKDNWAECGAEVEDWIHAWEGDLLELLKIDERLPKTVDLLFLDGMMFHLEFKCNTQPLTELAWTSLALPALKLVLPRLRDGSVVVADKTTAGKILYAPLS